MWLPQNMKFINGRISANFEDKDFWLDQKNPLKQYAEKVTIFEVTMQLHFWSHNLT